MTSPLSDIRVVELANYVAGPSVGALLCDLGADVIKVEPPGGEVMRGVMDASPNFLFELENRGKRSVTIALDRPGGPELLHRLIDTSDVFLTNMIRPRLEKFGLLPEDVIERSPRVVHVSVTGYGLQGPEADRPAFDFAAFWARSGIMSLVGHPGIPPVLSRVAQGDHTTGMNGLAATLAALRLRDRTGKGQVVEVSLQRTGLYTIATDVSRALVDGRQPAKLDWLAPPNPLFNSYETAGGEWIMVVHMTPDPYWAPFCRAIGKEEWATDPRFATMRLRMPHGAALAAEIQERFLEHSAAHWAEALDAHGLIWAPVCDLPAVLNDPQLRQTGAFAPIDHPSGPFETVATPFVIRDADICVRGAAGEAGGATSGVLAELGLDEERIAELASAGVFG